MVMVTMEMVDKEAPVGTVLIWTSLKISRVKMTKRKKAFILAKTKRKMKCLSTIFIEMGWVVTKVKTTERIIMHMVNRLTERSSSMLRQLKLMKPLKTRTTKNQKKRRRQTKRKRKLKRKRKRAMMMRHPRSKPNCN